MTAYHRTPDPRTVAEVVDCYGMHAARERWGWCGASLITKLANEGRRLAGRPTPSGILHEVGTAHSFLSPSWDGFAHRDLRLSIPHAAAALGTSQSALRSL